MKLLRVIASVDPATGGPVTGLRSFTPELRKLGHATEFLTLDAPEAPFLQDLGGPVHAIGPARSRYASSPRLRPWLRANLSRFDAVLVHGLWQDLGRAVRAVTQKLGGPPYFVMPHGMLDPALHAAYPLKHLKKRIYWRLFERRVLRDARAVLFTCEEERRVGQQSFSQFEGRGAVITYGTAGPVGEAAAWTAAWRERCPAVAGRPYFIFLGRVHSKKGIALLLSAYARLWREAGAAATAALPHLVVAGPCSDDSYLRSLRSLAHRERIDQVVHWPGMLSGADKWGALHGAEAFVLPSFQENFGLAVVEALACARPVLISDRVNIWRELTEDQAALVEPANEQGTFQLLSRWLALPAGTRETMAIAARASYAKRFEISAAAANFAAQLSQLAGVSS
jgi:glycosyltransferase involved in cell wall biosynthesis